MISDDESEADISHDLDDTDDIDLFDESPQRSLRRGYRFELFA